MDEARWNEHLSQIQTSWTLVFAAHRGSADAASAAQMALLERYAGAIHRYLLGATRDPETAEELAREFAVRFLRGDFHRADPRKGRFRDFIKRALGNLMIDDQRRRRRQPLNVLDGGVEPDDPGAGFWDLDARFLESWR
jgi:RNA polymerase sigma-70 factor (ECF subfamily)